MWLVSIWVSAFSELKCYFGMMVMLGATRNEAGKGVSCLLLEIEGTKTLNGATTHFIQGVQAKFNTYQLGFFIIRNRFMHILNAKLTIKFVLFVVNIVFTFFFL